MDFNDPDSIERAMNTLTEYIKLEGEFPFICCVSASASLASSLLLRNAREHPEGESLFKGAFFFSGITPFDYAALADGEVRPLDQAAKNLLITIPTANIWGGNDEKHAKLAATLNKFCTPEINETMIHNNGNIIPGAGHEADVVKAAQAIKRTVARAIPAF